MSNTHGVADMAKELQATTRDLLPACIVTTSWPTVPVPPSLTLAAFATAGYVRDGVDLVYCAQEAHTLTLTGGDGTYWLGLGQDTYTTVASWNRTAGTHYLWRPSATRPPDVDGLLVISSLTVSGGVITAVAPAAGVTRAEALRALAGLGTLATQNANAVAITGGTATLDDLDVDGTTLRVDNVNHRVGFGTPTPGYPVDVMGNMRLIGILGINIAPDNTVYQYMSYQGRHGLFLKAGVDTGAFYACGFLNASGVPVGTIVTSATATSYNTSSDARLKHAVQALTGALAAIQALRPVTFRWNATEESDIGFLAHELMGPVPTAVTGLPDEINPDGSVKPQQVDQSKLVPLLTAGIKELLAQVEALTARVTVLETALGV